MADNEQKALQLMADAEKKLTTQKGFFGSLFGCVFSFVCQVNVFEWKKSIVCHCMENKVEFIVKTLHSVQFCTFIFSLGFLLLYF